MSKSIVIPGVWGDPVAVVVNGKAYSYRAGATETVPDEVAAAIENALANAPHTEGYVADSVLPPIKAEDKGKALKTDETTGAPVWDEVSEVPAIAAGDTGKYLKAGSSGPEWAEAGGGGGVLIVTDEEGTLDKTWQEIHDAGFAVLHVADEGLVDIGVLHRCFEDDYNETYGVSFALWTSTGTVDDGMAYAASAPDGYPTLLEV